MICLNTEKKINKMGSAWENKAALWGEGGIRSLIQNQLNLTWMESADNIMSTNTSGQFVPI